MHLVVSNLRRSDFKVSSFRSENDSRQRDEVEKKSQKWKGSCDDQEWCPHRVLVFSFQGTRRADLVCLKWAHCLRVLIFIDAPLFHAMHNIQRIARMSRVGKWTIDTAESLQHRVYSACYLHPFLFHCFSVFIVKVAEEGVEQVVSRWWKNYCQLKTGKFMGEDRFGNRYYEDMEANELGNAVNGRHRWVEYPVGKKDYDSSTVAPEWHAWLHYISDVPGKQMEQAHRRKYSVLSFPLLLSSHTFSD